MRMIERVNLQRIVVLPALSRPRTRIRASLLPKTVENIRVNKIPILLLLLRLDQIRSNDLREIVLLLDHSTSLRSFLLLLWELVQSLKKKQNNFEDDENIQFRFRCLWFFQRLCLGLNIISSAHCNSSWLIGLSLFELLI